MTTTVEELGRAWEQYKSLNDTALAEAKRHGETSAEAKVAADRANAAIADIQERVAKAERETAEAKAQATELEERMNRPQAGGLRRQDVDDARMVRYAAFQSAVEGKEIDPAHVNLEWVGNYQTSFRSYMKYGPSAPTEHYQVLNAALQGDNPSGGFFVEPDMDGRQREFLRESDPLRGMASSQTITGDRLIGRILLGEAGSGWVGETDSRPATTSPTVAEYEIPLREMYAMPEASQRLVDMSTGTDIANWLEGQVRAKFSRDESTAFVTGNTPKRPRGFTTYTAGTPGDTPATWPFVEQVVSGAAATLTADGLHALVASMFPPFLRNSVFAMRRSTELVVRTMKDGSGNYLWQPDFAAPAKGQLLGYPVVLMADMPAIGAGAEPVAFADFAEAYQIVDSPVGMRVLVDNLTSKGYIRYYCTRYVGGDVVNFQAIKLQTCSV